MRSLCNKAIETFDKYHEILAQKALYVSDEMDLELNKVFKNIKDRVDINVNIISFFDKVN